MPRNLASNGYIVSKAALTALAKEYVDGIHTAENVRGTYLRVLVAHSQRELANSRHLSQVDAVQTAHAELYPVVLKAVTSEDIEPKEDASPEETRRRTRERNRRTTFARTSKSALLRWIEAGGKLSSLKPEDVTKDKLAVQTAPSPLPLEDQARNLAGRLGAVLRDIATADISAARTMLKEAEKQLEAAIPRTRQRRSSTVKQLGSGTRGELRMTAH